MISKFLDSYFAKINRIEVCQGTNYLVQYLKTTSLVLTRYLSGNPLTVVELHLGITSDGLPKDFGLEILDMIRMGNTSIVRVMLTVVNMHRMVLGNGDLKSDTITAPSTPNVLLMADIVEFVKVVISQMNLTLNFKFWTSPHHTTKAGPQGPALGASMADLFLLPETLIAQLRVIGGSEFSTYLSSMLSIPKQLVLVLKSKTQVLRRLSVIGDKSGKNRVIAIFDYWSQSALKPFHDAVMALLKQFPCDCTFNQNHIVELMKDFKEFYCYDLSAATDRFPLVLQQGVVSQFLGPRFAEAWAGVLVHLPFYHPSTDPVTYVAGQPMGAYSSWAVFTLTHHIVVQYSAYLVGLFPFKGYAILGDDLVIANRLVAEMYVSVISQLDVQISMMKSHTGLYLLDFAKRLWYKGVEITPFPTHALLTEMSNPFGLAQLLLEQISRGWKLLGPLAGIPGTSSTLAFLQSFSGRRSERLHTMIVEFMILISAMSKGTQGHTQEIYNFYVAFFKSNASITLKCSSVGSLIDFLSLELLDSLIISIGKAKALLRGHLDYANVQLSALAKATNAYSMNLDEFIDIFAPQNIPPIRVLEDQATGLMNLEDKLNDARQSGAASRQLENFQYEFARLHVMDPRSVFTKRTHDVVNMNKARQMDPIRKALSAQG